MRRGKDLESKSRIPEFSSREEEAEWFDTHDMADYRTSSRPLKRVLPRTCLRELPSDSTQIR